MISEAASSWRALMHSLTGIFSGRGWKVNDETLERREIP
jgi:hypothetical protein